MEFNNKIPEWKNEGTAPSEELINSGFMGGYKPPASVFNHMFNQYSKCIGETQEKLIDTHGELETAQEDIEKLETNVEELKPSEIQTGKVICIENSANLPLAGLNVYGKSTQDGTPTTDTPIDIVSVGDSGNVEVQIMGKNLAPSNLTQIENNGYITTPNSDGTVTVTGSANTTESAVCHLALVIDGKNFNTIRLKAGLDYILTVRKNGVKMTSSSFGIKTVYLDDGSVTWSNLGDKTREREIQQIYVQRSGEVGDTTLCGTYSVQLELGDTYTDYEPYKESQALTLSTPNGLAGIPVTSGGNYTDTEGQEWVCDEIDLERGVYVQRIYTKIFSGNETFGMHDTVLEDEDYYFSYYNDNFIHISDANSLAGTLCTHLVEQTANNLWRTSVNGFSMNTSGNHIRFRFLNITSVDELSTQLSEWYDNGTPLTIIGELATPIETPLTDAEIEAYKALKTNNPNTTIMNDIGADMKVEYIPQLYQGLADLILDRCNPVADNISIDNSISGLNANQVQGAIDELKGTIGYTSKNLLPIKVDTQTVSGVTFTVNSDGSITAKGTATSSIWHIINSSFTFEANEKYILSGCPQGGSSSKYYVYVGQTSLFDYGDGVNVSYANGFTGNIGICIMSGVTVNITFYPMIRYESIEDDTFESYVADVDTRINNLKTQVNGFIWKSLTQTLGTDSNNKPWLEIKAQYDTMKDYYMYGGSITCGATFQYIGYKVYSSNYASFLVHSYGTLYHVTNNAGTWRYSVISETYNVFE